MRGQHSKCRDTQTILSTGKTTKCSNFDTFKKDLIGLTCATMPEGDGTEELAAYLAQMKRDLTTMANHEATFTTKRDACESAESTLESHSNHCAAKQTEFEENVVTSHATRLYRSTKASAGQD